MPILSLEERGELITALFMHAQTGEDQTLSGSGTQMAYRIMAKAIDANYQHYDEVCAKRAEAGRRSREANANKSQQMPANADKSTPSTSTSTNTSSSTSTGTSTSTSTSLPKGDVVVCATAPTKTTTRTTWKAPELWEIKAYCIERGNNVDPERFFDYYNANGWKVGRNHMKDWKAAVRTWERKEKTTTKQKSFSEIAQELNAQFGG